MGWLQFDGLGMPDEMHQATADYVADQDRTATTARATKGVLQERGFSHKRTHQLVEGLRLLKEEDTLRELWPSMDG